MTDAEFEKINSDNENNEDESSQDSGVGIETSTGSDKVLVDETNSLDRWMVEGKRRTSQWTVPSLHRSMSMPANAQVCLVYAAS
jgi:hypothetical protein